MNVSDLQIVTGFTCTPYNTYFSKTISKSHNRNNYIPNKAHDRYVIATDVRCS